MAELRVQLAADTFSPGEQIDGTVSWTMPAPPVKGELRLRWDTAGKGDRDSRIVGYVKLSELPRRHTAGALYRDAPRRAADVPPLESVDDRWFRFPAPDAPLSFSGRLISLTWSIEVVAHPKVELSTDALANGEIVQVPIVVSPTGRELTAYDDGIDE